MTAACDLVGGRTHPFIGIEVVLVDRPPSRSPNDDRTHLSQVRCRRTIGLCESDRPATAASAGWFVPVDRSPADRPVPRLPAPPLAPRLRDALRPTPEGEESRRHDAR